MAGVVLFPTGKLAAAARRIPTDDTREDLGRLVDGLQVLACTRPAAVIVIKRIVFGLLELSTDA